MSDKENPEKRRFITKAEFRRIQRGWIVNALIETAHDPSPYSDLLGDNPVNLGEVRKRKELRSFADKMLKGEPLDDSSNKP